MFIAQHPMFSPPNPPFNRIFASGAAGVSVLGASSASFHGDICDISGDTMNFFDGDGRHMCMCIYIYVNIYIYICKYIYIQGTRSLGMTFGADADDALWRHIGDVPGPPDDALWRHIPWRRIAPCSMYIYTHTGFFKKNSHPLETAEIPCLPPQPPTSMLWSEVPSIINRNGCFLLKAAEHKIQKTTLNWGTGGDMTSMVWYFMGWLFFLKNPVCTAQFVPWKDPKAVTFLDFVWSKMKIW